MSIWDSLKIGYSVSLSDFVRSKLVHVDGIHRAQFCWSLSTRTICCSYCKKIQGQLVMLLNDKTSIK